MHRSTGAHGTFRRNGSTAEEKSIFSISPDRLLDAIENDAALIGRDYRGGMSGAAEGAYIEDPSWPLPCLPRPKKLMPDQCKEALQRLEPGETQANVARSYGLSAITVRRMVRSARPSGGLAR